MANKVTFGLSNLYVCTYTVGTGGTVTLGTPYHQRGAVSLNLEAEGDESSFAADNNARYWSHFSDNGFSGTLETAMFDDEFKKQFLGFRETQGGGLGQVKNATKPAVCILFQIEGDETASRCILYNCALGNITKEHSTTEDTIEPTTDSLDFTVTGDNETGLTKNVFGADSDAYATFFTAPPAPAFASTGTGTGH